MAEQRELEEFISSCKHTKYITTSLLRQVVTLQTEDYFIWNKLIFHPKKPVLQSPSCCNLLVVLQIINDMEILSFIKNEMRILRNEKSICVIRRCSEIFDQLNWPSSFCAFFMIWSSVHEMRTLLSLIISPLPEIGIKVVQNIIWGPFWIILEISFFLFRTNSIFKLFLIFRLWRLNQRKTRKLCDFHSFEWFKNSRSEKILFFAEIPSRPTDDKLWSLSSAIYNESKICYQFCHTLKIVLIFRVLDFWILKKRSIEILFN